MYNGPFTAEQSRGTKSPNWRTNDALGYVKERKFKIGGVCATCSIVSFVLQFEDFVPRDRPAAKGPLMISDRTRLFVSIDPLSLVYVCMFA